MKKKIISLALALVLAIGIFAVPALAATANPTAATVLVNGSNVSFDAYNINDFNYFKLRDLAYTLNGTAKQFSVGWDEANNAITLTSGQPYESVGGEMASRGAGSKNAEPSASRIFLDGREVQFSAYLIEGNNYFKLRDIGEAFDFGVNWDEAAETISIDTSIGYTPEDATPPETTPEQPTTPPSVGDTELVLPDGHFWYTGLVPEASRFEMSFRSNGEFEYYIRWTMHTSGNLVYEEKYNGTYSASNGILSFTYNSAQRSDMDTNWIYQSIALPTNLSLPYEIYEIRYEDTDDWGNVIEIRIQQYLKLWGGLPSVEIIPEYEFHVRDSDNRHVSTRIRPRQKNPMAALAFHK